MCKKSDANKLKPICERDLTNTTMFKWEKSKADSENMDLSHTEPENDFADETRTNQREDMENDRCEGSNEKDAGLRQAKLCVDVTNSTWTRSIVDSGEPEHAGPKGRMLTLKRVIDRGGNSISA